MTPALLPAFLFVVPSLADTDPLFHWPLVRSRGTARPFAPSVTERMVVAATDRDSGPAQTEGLMAATESLSGPGSGARKPQPGAGQRPATSPFRPNASEPAPVPDDVSAAARESSVVLWDPEVPVPGPGEIERLENTRFEVVKLREPEVDGYVWLHGMAIWRYRGVFFTSWGANVGRENTVGEVALGRRSADDCHTWSEVEAIGPSIEGEGRSHGVFLEHGGKLWAFHSRFGKGEGRMFPGLSMEAFTLNEATDTWEAQGIAADNFWPMMEPVRMQGGNWFVAGCDGDWRAAVAVSHGDDLLRWDTVKIDVGERVITEANAWVDKDNITLVMRNQSPLDPGNIRAAVSFSTDFGRTWTVPAESNMPLSTCQPFCGTLSTGQRYLIGNSVQGGNNSRRHLTIAVSRPRQELLSRMWLIRDSAIPEALRDTYGYTDPQNLAYPHAIEHDGKLYVVYSAGHLPANQNSGELAVIPIADLAVTDD